MGPKGFVLYMGGHRERVTLDRLKLAHRVFRSRFLVEVALLPGPWQRLSRFSILLLGYHLAAFLLLFRLRHSAPVIASCLRL